MENRQCTMLYWASWVLVFNSLGIVYGLWSHLFGTPSIGNFFSVVSFLVVAGIGIGFYGSRKRRSSQECPPLTETYPMLKSVKPYLRPFEIGLGIVIASNILMLALLFSNKGVYNTDYSTPIFALRDPYYLLNHGSLTEVSRSEYILNGISFQVGWHSLIVMASLSLWKQIAFGRSS